MTRWANSKLQPSSPEFAEFAFGLPAGADGARAPRALLSLRVAGSMRFISGEPNPLRHSFFSSLGLPPKRVLATELHHTRRIRILETAKLPAASETGADADVASLPGDDVGDGGPEGAQGRDGIIILPARDARAPRAGPRADDVAGPIPTITVADCMPIWLWDASLGAWGILHSGWKGTGILERAVRALEARGGSAAAMSVILGPSIGVCCYDVSEERATAFAREFGDACVDRSGPAPRLDLRAANLGIARRLGLGATLSIDACTSCEPALGSFRREGPASFTRMVAACVPR